MTDRIKDLNVRLALSRHHEALDMLARANYPEHESAAQCTLSDLEDAIERAQGDGPTRGVLLVPNDEQAARLIEGVLGNIDKQMETANEEYEEVTRLQRRMATAVAAMEEARAKVASISGELHEHVRAGAEAHQRALRAAESLSKLANVKEAK